jgi:hypothetical protein
MMIVVVAAAGVCYVAIRAHPSLGALVAGITGLALIRTFEAIDRFGLKGTTLRPTDVVRSFLVSTFIAGTILLAALLPSFCLFAVINAPRTGHLTPRVRAEDLVGIVIAALVGLPIASLMRRRLW